MGGLFIGSHMGNLYVSLDGMNSQKVVPDINVFDSRMLTRIVSNLYGILIVTEERGMVQSVTIDL
jgi:hypothetical protein